MTEDEKKKKNKAVDRTNKLKYVAKGLQGIKAISNALGTSPTETPDVNTKIDKSYDPGGGGKPSGGSDRPYSLDENGVGGFVDERSTPKFRNKKMRDAY